MAGYVINGHKDGICFHVGERDLVKRIMESNDNRRVLTIQIDCDELEAVLEALQPGWRD